MRKPNGVAKAKRSLRRAKIDFLFGRNKSGKEAKHEETTGDEAANGGADAA